MKPPGIHMTQTEMGHGSNVKGLELEAKWDPKAKDFVLHSPTLTSSKWWNGSMGRTANHAIVVAQLMLPDQKGVYKSYGPHPFIVQIRDLSTHQPLPGIVVGDIGPKYGYPAMDNGYMLFNQFRIPHSAFLSRYSRVDPETGVYSKPVNSAVVYGSLTYVRAKIVMHARLVLARAVTVGVRYLSIRRQFRDRDGSNEGAEMAVLDYPTVQIRILPLLATTFALHYSGRAMGDLYEHTRKDISSGDFSALAEMHSTSSGLKSLCTTIAADGIEVTRRACGGHGYGGGTGLIALNNEYLSKPTVEGDNWMITQQTASAIIKQVSAVIKSPDAIPSDLTSKNLQQYYKSRSYDKAGNFFDVLHNDKAIVDAFSNRAAHLSFKAHKQRIDNKRSWNSMLIQLHKLSRAHSQAILVRNFYEALETDTSMSANLKPVLRDCFRLFSLYTMDNEAREFYNAGGVSNDQLDALPDRVQDLMAKIRPHAVSLVDAWSIPEYLLDSALGRYDGKVYEDLFDRAHRLNPLNKETFNPNFWEEEIVKGSNDGAAILAKL
jgi:acyl-CoA oxidase